MASILSVSGFMGFLFYRLMPWVLWLLGLVLFILVIAVLLGKIWLKKYISDKVAGGTHTAHLPSLHATQHRLHPPTVITHTPRACPHTRA